MQLTWLISKVLFLCQKEEVKTMVCSVFTQ